MEEGSSAGEDSSSGLMSSQRGDKSQAMSSSRIPGICEDVDNESEEETELDSSLDVTAESRPEEMLAVSTGEVIGYDSFTHNIVI